MAYDKMTTIPLRGSSKHDQETYLADSHAIFQLAYHGATNVITFFKAAQKSGVSATLASHAQETLLLARARDLLVPPKGADLSKALPGLVERVTQLTLGSAKQAITIAALTLWHSALEEYLLRLLRLAAVVNRAGVLARVGGRKATIAEIRSRGIEAIEDDAIEAWLKEASRDSLPRQWEITFAITPPTETIRKSTVNFELQWITNFDEARHDGVHGSGNLAAEFDLEDAQDRMFRYGFGLWVQYASAYGLRVDPYRLFGVPVESVGVETLLKSRGLGEAVRE